MDTVTHALTGAVIGYCGFRQRGGRVALWTAIAAAEFPDIDILLAPFGSETYFRWHRSFTHSALLLPFWAVALAGLFCLMAGRKNYRLLLAASAAGLASHLLLDWITNYGTLLLWPLSDARLALSWVFILDPYVWALLGVVLWAVSRTRPPLQVRVARFGLGCFCGYVLICGECHWMAARAAARPPGTTKLEVFPQPMHPFRFTIVRQNDSEVHWINGHENETFVQFRDDKLLPQAEATEPVKLFRWFAEFPLVEERQQNGQSVLEYRDLRFRTPAPDGHVSEGKFAVVEVAFDPRGRLLSSTWTYRRR